MVKTCCVVFSFLISLIGSAICNQNQYCDLSCDNGRTVYMNTACKRQNMMCKNSTTCGPNFKEIPLDDIDRQYILDLHNYLRNKVAMGYEPRGNQPAAANIKALRYNKELEFLAQCWVNVCPDNNILVHDKCRRTKEFAWVGQNLANMGSTDPSEVTDIGNMIKQLTLGWYDEVEYFNSSWINFHQARNVMIGHYTQLVWADTKEIGCAISSYSFIDEKKKKWYYLALACNYGPGGNYLEQPVYKIGKPATKCSGGKNNKRFPGLCGVDILVNQTRRYNNEFFNYHI